MSSTVAEAFEREDRMIWRGVIAEFLQDETRYIDIEGAFRSGKTTACLRKVAKSCVKHPGINWLICRYSDGDTQTKLKPPWRAMCRRMGIQASWDAMEQCDVFPCMQGDTLCQADEHEHCGGKRSRVYIFGVKSQDQTSRYGKFRGMTLGGIYNDQTEELPHDVFLEMTGRLSQSGYPHQLILSPNPPDENHWLAREFPEDNRIKGRKYYSAPIFANAHNLPPDTIDGLIGAYPPSHPKHRSAVLGKRGLNVIGLPVYGGDPEKGLAPMFNRQVHVRPLQVNPELPLLTGFDFGTHHPCAVFAQYTPWGQMMLLGGVLGQSMFLEDFAPIVQQYRSMWFPNASEHRECCDPAGAHVNDQGVRKNGVMALREHGFNVEWKEHSNAADVRLTMIERIAGHMRRTTPQGPAIGVEQNPQRWMIVAPDYTKSWPFVADAFEAGYVWDELTVSVGGKAVRRPKKDGWYDHGMNCCEYIEINFGGAQPTLEQIRRHATARKASELRQAQRDIDPYDLRMKRPGARRGGY